MTLHCTTEQLCTYNRASDVVTAPASPSAGGEVARGQWPFNSALQIELALFSIHSSISCPILELGGRQLYHFLPYSGAISCPSLERDDNPISERQSKAEEVWSGNETKG